MHSFFHSCGCQALCRLLGLLQSLAAFSERSRRPACSSTVPFSNTKHPRPTSDLNLLFEDLGSSRVFCSHKSPRPLSFFTRVASLSEVSFSALIPGVTPPPGCQARRLHPGPALAFSRLRPCPLLQTLGGWTNRTISSPPGPADTSKQESDMAAPAKGENLSLVVHGPGDIRLVKRGRSVGTQAATHPALLSPSGKLSSGTHSRVLLLIGLAGGPRPAPLTAWIYQDLSWLPGGGGWVAVIYL